MTSFTASQRITEFNTLGSQMVRQATESFRAMSQPTQSLSLAGGGMAMTSTALPAPSLPLSEAAQAVAQLLTRPSTRSMTAEAYLADERLNCLTHGAGLVAAVMGLGGLMSLSTGSPAQLLGVTIYGLALVLLYGSSTLLHASANSERWQRRFQAADHVCIYLLIAGTYTPFMLTVMAGTIGYTLLACVWGLAAYGIRIKLKFADRLEQTSSLPYVVLGWLALAAIKPMMDALPTGGLMLLIAGGVSYSLGVLFYLRDDRRYFHAIWHGFVLLGSATHFAAVMLYAV